MQEWIFNVEETAVKRYLNLLLSLGLILTSMSAISVVASAQAAKATMSGNLEAIFNYPSTDGTQDYAIANKVADLINSAKSGSIYGTLFMYDAQDPAAPNITNDLLAAQSRGVAIHLIAEKNDVYQQDTDYLKNHLTGSSSFVYCTASCQSNASDATYAIMHDKFWVFDSLNDGRTNVAIQASGNLATGQAGEANNAIVSYNDTKLTTAFKNQFNKMSQHAGDSVDTKNSGYSTGSNGADVYFYPRDLSADQSTFGNSDVDASFINQVNCSGNGVIRMSGANFDTQSKLAELYTALSSKQQQGCSIQMNLRDVQDSASQFPSMDELTGLNIPIYASRPGGCRYFPTPAYYGCGRGSVHSKYILTEWTDSSGTHKNVYSGSHNWTSTSLKLDDEAVLHLTDPTMYQAFVNNFNALMNQAIDIYAPKYSSTPSHYQRVNVPSEGDQHYSAIASNSSGYTAVAFEDGDRHDSSNPELGTDIYLRDYLNGSPLWNDIKLTNGNGSTNPPNSTWYHQKPDVAVDSSGNMIVVWADDTDGNGSGEIAVVKVSPAGAVTPLPRPHASGVGDQIRPTVAVDAGDNYVVAWEDRTQGNVFASRFTSAGTVIYQDKQISAVTGSGGSNQHPDIAADATGDATVVWEDDADGNGYFNVRLSELSPTGTTRIGSTVANTMTDGQQTLPAVAMEPTGEIIVAWEDQSSGVRSPRVWQRVFRADGTPVGAEKRSAPYGSCSGTESTDLPTPSGVGIGECVGPQFTPDVAVAPDGTFVVVWKEEEQWRNGSTLTDIWAAGFNFDGSTSGRLPSTRINVITGNNQAGPAVTLNSAGVLSFSYSDDYDGNLFNDVRLRWGFRNA